jgi:hypothetical protein
MGPQDGNISVYGHAVPQLRLAASRAEERMAQGIRNLGHSEGRRHQNKGDEAKDLKGVGKLHAGIHLNSV